MKQYSTIWYFLKRYPYHYRYLLRYPTLLMTHVIKKVLLFSRDGVRPKLPPTNGSKDPERAAAGGRKVSPLLARFGRKDSPKGSPKGSPGRQLRHSSHHLFILFLFILSVVSRSFMIFIQIFIGIFIHWFIYPSIQIFIHSFIHSFIYSFIHIFIHSFIHLFIHSFLHSCYQFTWLWIHTCTRVPLEVEVYLQDNFTITWDLKHKLVK